MSLLPLQEKNDTAFRSSLSALAGKRILITGGRGYLASGILRQLAAVPCKITLATRDVARVGVQSGLAQVEERSLDLGDQHGWTKIMDGVDCAFHLAAQTSLSMAEQDVAADVRDNVLPLVMLVQACRELKICPAVVFTGTATEVGLTSNVPVDENFQDHPCTVYDLNKLTAERYLKYFATQGSVNGVALRLANVYGPGSTGAQPDRGILNKMVKKALAGESLVVYGDGNYVRDYVYIDDVARACLLAAAQASRVKGENFVLGSGHGVKLVDAFNLVAEIVAERTGKRVTVEHVPEPATLMTIEKRNFVANSQRFREATGWSPRVTLDAGIRLTAEFLAGAK